ncbi:MAG: hypothetical protein RLZZ416_761 [Candidatus Parcubacteria bacterium]|jgi:hypothetical protein
MSASLPLHRHPAPHRELARRYRYYARTREFRSSVLVATLALVAAWFINYFAIRFATEHASNAVTDVILSNIPVFEVDALFVYGTFFFAIMGLGIVLAHPKRIPFAFKTVALFWLIRSIFASLTHVAPFETSYMSDFGPAITNAFFGGDLFFSAHTGMPFLGALGFWNDKGIRYTLLGGSVFFAVIVLLGHVHYSIDVLSAYFITYGIFQIALRLFPKDRNLFYSDLPPETTSP